MAIQATEDATTFREWLLLGTALARVIEYLGPGSEDAAKELLLEYLHRGEIPWDCRRLDFGDGWTAETAHRFFFECHESVVHDVDWPNHRATRAGPVFMSVSAIGAKVLAHGPRNHSPLAQHPPHPPVLWRGSLVNEVAVSDGGVAVGVAGNHAGASIVGPILAAGDAKAEVCGKRRHIEGVAAWRG